MSKKEFDEKFSSFVNKLHEIKSNIKGSPSSVSVKMKRRYNHILDQDGNLIILVDRSSGDIFKPLGNGGGVQDGIRGNIFSKFNGTESIDFKTGEVKYLKQLNMVKRNFTYYEVSFSKNRKKEILNFKEAERAIEYVIDEKIEKYQISPKSIEIMG